MFWKRSPSSISLATVTPSLVTVGAPKDFSITTLRPLGPSVTGTASERICAPRKIWSRAAWWKLISFAAIWVFLRGASGSRAFAAGRACPCFARGARNIRGAARVSRAGARGRACRERRAAVCLASGTLLRSNPPRSPPETSSMRSALALQALLALLFAAPDPSRAQPSPPAQQEPGLPASGPHQPPAPPPGSAPQQPPPAAAQEPAVPPPPPTAPPPPLAAGTARVEGKVTLAGLAPNLATLPVSRDLKICGAPKPDEPLLRRPSA